MVTDTQEKAEYDGDTPNGGSCPAVARPNPSEKTHMMNLHTVLSVPRQSAGLLVAEASATRRSMLSGLLTPSTGRSICGAVHHPRATIGCMERVQHEAVVRDLPVGRLLAVDERGVGLRVTWRLDHGFINLSLWRADRCVETFHLTPADAAQLVSFIVSGLADAAPVADRVTLQAVAPISSRSFTHTARAAVTRFRELGAGMLRGLADSLDEASR